MSPATMGYIRRYVKLVHHLIVQVELMSMAQSIHSKLSSLFNDPYAKVAAEHRVQYPPDARRHF